MNKNGYIIRLDRKNEREETQALVRQFFWGVYRERCVEHYLLHILRGREGFYKNLNFVMEKKGKLIGQIVFFKTKIRLDDGSTLPVATMGSLCMSPHYQRQGYGKALPDFVFQKVAAAGIGGVFFEGDVRFCVKCGCEYARNKNIRYRGLPTGADDSFFSAKS